MSTSDVAIANEALILLGALPITALTEDVKAARTISAVFESVRQSALRAHRWRFSILRTSLPADATAPDSDYDYRYLLPNDYLRLLEGADIVSLADLTDIRSGSAAQPIYSLEGRYILTNLSAPLHIRYIADVTDPSVFDVCFRRVFAAELALTCCEAITQSDSKKQLARQREQDALRDARRANALEVASQSVADDSWVLARTQ